MLLIFHCLKVAHKRHTKKCVNTKRFQLSSPVPLLLLLPDRVKGALSTIYTKLVSFLYQLIVNAATDMFCILLFVSLTVATATPPGIKREDYENELNWIDVGTYRTQCVITNYNTPGCNFWRPINCHFIVLTHFSYCPDWIFVNVS